MNCRRATRLIAEARDRPLSWRERVGLQLHRCTCTPCRRFRRDLERLRLLIARSSTDWLPRRERVRTALRRTGS